MTTTRPDGTKAISKYTQQVPITLTDLGFSFLLLALAFVAARSLPGLMEIVFLERLPLVPSVRYTITSLKIHHCGCRHRHGIQCCRHQLV